MGFDNAAVIDYLEALATAKLGPRQSPAKTSASASHVQSCSHGRAEALKKPRPSCSPDRRKVSANCDKGAFQDPPSVAAGLESQGSVPMRWSPLSCTGTVNLTVFYYGGLKQGRADVEVPGSYTIAQLALFLHEATQRHDLSPSLS